MELAHTAIDPRGGRQRAGAQREISASAGGRTGEREHGDTRQVEDGDGHVVEVELGHLGVVEIRVVPPKRQQLRPRHADQVAVHVEQIDEDEKEGDGDQKLLDGAEGAAGARLGGGVVVCAVQDHRRHVAHRSSQPSEHAREEAEETEEATASPPWMRTPKMGRGLGPLVTDVGEVYAATRAGTRSKILFYSCTRVL